MACVRDLLIELFRMKCAAVGIRHFCAVADEYRLHRSAWFGELVPEKVLASYNPIWEDRGGVRVHSMHYRLETSSARRETSAIPAKKRKMYKSRYQLLDTLADQMRVRLIQMQARDQPALLAS